MKRLGVLLIGVVACACPSKSTSGPTSGSGSAKVVAPPPTTAITSCDTARDKIEALYRAEAQVKEPKRVDEAIADNTAMVLADCKKAPDRVVPCLATAQTLADVETKCVKQLDDEGTEGEQQK
jgi:hypothetical protein